MEHAPKPGRLFIGIAIPPTPMEVIKSNRKRFASMIQTRVPLKNWHVTLVFLGEVKDTQAVIDAFPKELSLPFVPVLSVTHVGQGKAPDSLWAYIQATPAMQALKTTLEEQLQSAGISYDTAKNEHDFVPHVSLARIEPENEAMGVLDVASPATFPVREITLYQSQEVDGEVTYTPLTVATITE